MLYFLFYCLRFHAYFESLISKIYIEIPCNCYSFIAYIPPHLRGGGGSNQRSADGFQDNYHGGRSGGRGMTEKLALEQNFICDDPEILPGFNIPIFYIVLCTLSLRICLGHWCSCE